MAMALLWPCHGHGLAMAMAMPACHGHGLASGHGMAMAMPMPIAMAMAWPNWAHSQLIIIMGNYGVWGLGCHGHAMAVIN